MRFHFLPSILPAQGPLRSQSLPHTTRKKKNTPSTTHINWGTYMCTHSPAAFREPNGEYVDVNQQDGKERSKREFVCVHVCAQACAHVSMCKSVVGSRRKSTGPQIRTKDSSQWRDMCLFSALLNGSFLCSLSHTHMHAHKYTNKHSHIHGQSCVYTRTHTGFLSEH